MKTTTAIIQETRKTLADGTHPVKLRITHNRKRKYYSVNVDPERTSLSADEWKKLFERTKGGKSFKYKSIYADIRSTISETENQAKDVIKELPVFSFEAFEAKFFKKQSKVDLFAAMEETAKGMRKEGRIKTAATYESALMSLKEFTKTDKLLFTKVNQEFLKKYQIWMLSSGNSKKKKGIRIGGGNSETTIGMYLRNVRAAFNKAGIKDESYPFGKDKYVIPTGRNIKKALTIQDIHNIYKYDAAPGSYREKYRDFWMLSYFCNGANIKDLSLLKYKDIDGESITFIRSKTARKVNRKVVVPLTIEIARILDKYGQKPTTPDNFILPILNKDMNAEKRQVAIDNAVRAINEHIKIIAGNIGITANVSTYTARHSFATVLKRSGASIEFISESLGHHNLNTTENYLADFEMDAKKEMAKHLTNWKHEDN